MCSIPSSNTRCLFHSIFFCNHGAIVFAHVACLDTSLVGFMHLCCFGALLLGLDCITLQSTCLISMLCICIYMYACLRVCVCVCVCKVWLVVKVISLNRSITYPSIQTSYSPRYCKAVGSLLMYQNCKFVHIQQMVCLFQSKTIKTAFLNDSPDVFCLTSHVPMPTCHRNIIS